MNKVRYREEAGMYHHHNHSAIIGDDMQQKYGERWNNFQRVPSNLDEVNVPTAHFVRGQGAIHTALGVPINKDTKSNRILGRNSISPTIIDNERDIKWRYHRAENKDFYRKSIISKGNDHMLNIKEGTSSKGSLPTNDFNSMS